MDLLMQCASVFRNLMNYQYRFTLGRKGQLTEITLGFSETEFHHLETRLDHDQLVFRYNKKIYPYSAIEREFLLKMGDGTNQLYTKE